MMRRVSQLGALPLLRRSPEARCWRMERILPAAYFRALSSSPTPDFNTSVDVAEHRCALPRCASKREQVLADVVLLDLSYVSPDAETADLHIS
jgi:hypothetical protein